MFAAPIKIAIFEKEARDSEHAVVFCVALHAQQFIAPIGAGEPGKRVAGGTARAEHACHGFCVLNVEFSLPELFEDVIMKRNAALQAGDDPATRGPKETELAAPVSKLMALAEDYPDLKASDNFKELQDELSETENKIEMARRFYNGAVREMNVAVESFPGNLIAGMFQFGRRHFFEISMADRAMPDLNLGGSS